MQFDVERIVRDVEAAIAQGSMAALGQHRGKMVEADYENALNASAKFWEFYSYMNSGLSRAIEQLRKARQISPDAPPEKENGK